MHAQQDDAMARNFGRIPTTPGGSWKGALGRGSGAKEAHVNRLGNLALLPPGLNPRIGNQDFSLKKTAYRETGLLLLGDVFRKNKWNKQAIEARERHSSASQWMLGPISKDQRQSAVWKWGDGGWRRWIQSWAAATEMRRQESFRLPDAPAPIRGLLNVDPTAWGWPSTVTIKSVSPMPRTSSVSAMLTWSRPAN